MNDRRIDRIETAYNPEFDIPRDGQPPVTWVDMALLELIEQLNAKIEKLEKKINDGGIDEADAMFRQHRQMKRAMRQSIPFDGRPVTYETDDNISPAELGLQEF